MRTLNIDFTKASKYLSEVFLKFRMDDHEILVNWLRGVYFGEGNNLSRHAHISYEFHFIYSGRCLVRLDDREFYVSAGEFYVNAPGVYHEQIFNDADKGIELCLNCDIDRIEYAHGESDALIERLNQAPCSNYRDTEGVMDLFVQALKEAQDRRIGHLTNIKSLIYMLINTTSRILTPQQYGACEGILKDSVNDVRVKKIEKFIEDNIENNLTISDISTLLYLSDKQVYRILKEKRGLSVKQLIEKITMTANDGWI